MTSTIALERMIDRETLAQSSKPIIQPNPLIQEKPDLFVTQMDHVDLDLLNEQQVAHPNLIIIPPIESVPSHPEPIAMEPEMERAPSHLYSSVCYKQSMAVRGSRPSAAVHCFLCRTLADIRCGSSALRLHRAEPASRSSNTRSAASTSLPRTPRFALLGFSLYAANTTSTVR